jgi:two-component system, chemotaxis family, protein-glutamate methylesterase/glutaminase
MNFSRWAVGGQYLLGRLAVAHRRRHVRSMEGTNLVDGTGGRRDVVVIGASAGGVQALQKLVGGLPKDFPAAIFIVLHVWAGAKTYLAEILQRAGQLPAVEAENGMAIERGRIYTAPSDAHLLLELGRISVVRGPKENRARPAINPLFRSAASTYLNRVIGIILSGTLDDGAAGLWAIKQCGGVAVVQSDAEFTEMPRTAAENVEVDYQLPLSEIAGCLNRVVHEPIAHAAPSSVPPIVRASNGATTMKPTGLKLDEIGQRSYFSCPECNGALWEVTEGVLEYRCHVGHAYSAYVLKTAQESNIEQSLWTALRALKESAALDDRLAERSAEHGLEVAANAHRNNAQAKLTQAEYLQQFLAVLQTNGDTPRSAETFLEAGGLRQN